MSGHALEITARLVPIPNKVRLTIPWSCLKLREDAGAARPARGFVRRFSDGGLAAGESGTRQGPTHAKVFNHASPESKPKRPDP